MVVGVLGVLVYFQFRTWRRFDWRKFKEGTEGIRYWKVLAAVLLIYTADFLRAIRWKIFLLPTHPRASWTGLIAPQYVGFAGLALLGRPGELVRPYLIARKEGLTMSSQMAIWFVERVFDTGAVTVMLVVDIFLVHSIRDIEHYQAFQKAGYAISGVVIRIASGYRRLRAYLAMGSEAGKQPRNKIAQLQRRPEHDQERFFFFSTGDHFTGDLGIGGFCLSTGHPCVSNGQWATRSGTSGSDAAIGCQRGGRSSAVARGGWRIAVGYYRGARQSV